MIMKEDAMDTSAAWKTQFPIKEPGNLSPRIEWLRNYYFRGLERPWNNEFTSWGTGEPWDVQYDETTFYIVPETYAFFSTFKASFLQAAQTVELHEDFWSWSLPERRSWFIKEVMINHLPQEIIPGDLIAGARFNIQTSKCWTKEETAQRNKLMYGKKRCPLKNWIGFTIVDTETPGPPADI